MGQEKSLLPFEDTTLLGHAVRVLASLGLTVAVVARPDQHFPGLSVPVLTDLEPDTGPLGGLVTALTASETLHNYFLPCDTPFIQGDLFYALSRFAGAYDAVVPEDSQGRLHPLCAFYSRRCLTRLHRLWREGGREVRGVLEAGGFSVFRLPAPRWGIPDRCFFNVNTPQDLTRLSSR